MVIDLLRHGETTAGQCFLGKTDASLTDKGWRQMHDAVVHQKYDLIITSPLSRCHEFAKQYAAQANIHCVVESNLSEYGFGDWEGKTSEEIWQCDRAKLSSFWNDPYNHVPPGGESFQEFNRRINLAVETYLRAFKGENVLVVAHGGVIRQIFMCMLNKSWQQVMKIRVDHGEIKRIFRTANGLRLQDDCTLCDYM